MTPDGPATDGGTKGRLTTGRKLAYGVADVGASLSYNAINFFLLFFLVNVLELRPALAGSVLLVGRFVDAFTDPLMGMITDRTRSRWGRRMPYMVAGFVPLGLSFVLLWAIPEGPQWFMFTLAALALSLHTILYTVVQVPYMSLTPELAPEYAQRTSLTSYRIGFGTFASLVAAAAPPLVVAAFDPGGAGELGRQGREGWLALGAIFGGVIALSYGLMLLGVREPRGARPAAPPAGFGAEVRSALRIYGFREIVALFVVTTLGLGIVSSMLPFYLDAVLGLAAGEQSLVLGALFVTAILSLPLWSRLSARRGKRFAFGCGLACVALALVALVLGSPAGLSAYLITMSVVAGIGTGAVLLFPWAMLPDVVEFDELATGRRREGLVYAIFTFGQKAAFAVAVFVNGQVQEWTGYVPNAVEQSGTATLGITWTIGPGAALVFLVALLVLRAFPITPERHAEVRLELESRGGGPVGRTTA